MAQKATSSHDKSVSKSKERQGNGLPVPIHPDDAKDKVFTAILKALLKMGNKPSSPKELANIIVKYKYATLGGATPFATVSSRISQHFKRAAEHNPPRAPLLAKHVDQNHSRKINYSLATESVSSTTEETAANNDEEEDDDIPDPTRTNSKTRRAPTTKKITRSHVNNNDDDSEDDHPLKKHKTEHHSSPHPHIDPSTTVASTSPPTLATGSDEESEGELSDYHEEMLKGDLDVNLPGKRLSRRKSSIARSLRTKATNTPSNTNTTPNTTNHNTSIPSSSKSLAPPSSVRKPSFSFNSGFPGEQELWTPFSFEHDFDNVFLHDSSTAHNIPFNIATPESVSVNELDDYFAASSSTNRSQRKSFSSSMLGPNDKSLLQKVLLASAARGVADKIDEEKEKLETIKEAPPEEESKDPIVSDTTTPEQPVKIEPASKPTEPINSDSLMDVTNGEDFVKFEEDEKKETPPPPTRKMTEILPATPNVSAAEILKSMNIQNLNLSALQQVSNSIPAPTFDLAKTMAAYMQSLAKSASANTSPASSTHAMDLKSILTRFPVLEAFIKKDAGTSTPPLVSPTTGDFVPNLTSTAGSTEPIVHTLTTMNPPMYITLVDHVAVCIVVLAKTDTTPEYRIMRRMDTGFINGTVLLTAGGIETESERSMILSFEMERVRMPKKKSPLFGTWIPLRRAQELAVTCSIQNKLGHFLEDSIEQYFPSPLPIQITPRKPTRDGRLTALALAALRSEVKNNEFVVPPISRQSSSSGNMSALTELLMTHPHKALKSNGLLSDKASVLLGDKDQVIKPTATTRQNSTSSISSRNASDKEESDVDIVNTSDSSAASSNEEESDHEEPKSKISALNLEEVLSRVAAKQPLHVHPRDLQKKRRRNSIEKKDAEEEPATKASKTNNSVRKKPASGNSKTGKNTTVAIKRSASGTGTTITIKRPAASGKKTSGNKLVTKAKEEKMDEEIDNVVVEHKATPVDKTKSDSSVEAKKTPSEEDEDDDEDEDIDIGGSDCDDDLR